MLSNMPDETVFEVDPFWAKPCRAYHVQHEPDQANIRQITEFQDHIEATSAGELHRMPVLSLHMTVLTLRSATASVAPGAEALWSQHKEKWLERIGDVCSSTRPVAIELNSIRATRGAIILSGDESEDLKQFREQLVAAVSLPDWKPTPPNIAHRSELQLDTLTSIHRCDFVTRIQLTGIAVVQECRYPSLERIFLEQFALS
jgi:hypothetical protein